jgi:SOS response regulatory protein OraA/RecX
VAAPRLTALRRAGPGRVALEVDGRPWRTVPDDVVVRTGLGAGTALERPVLRALRRELQRARALGVAGRALARRDLSAEEVGRRLERAGVAAPVAGEVGETLRAVRVLDDRRVAATRAGSLADRGWGDAAIEAKLAQAGLDEALVRAAVAELEPESERARRVVAGAADPAKAARRLAARGFAPETVGELFGAGLD